MAVLDSQGNIATWRAEAPGPGSELGEALAELKRRSGAAVPGAAGLVPAPAHPWPRPKPTFRGRRPPKAGGHGRNLAEERRGKGGEGQARRTPGTAEMSPVSLPAQSRPLHRRKQPAASTDLEAAGL